jgi:hypothetical protein
MEARHGLLSLTTKDERGLEISNLAVTSSLRIKVVSQERSPIPNSSFDVIQEYQLGDYHLLRPDD